MSWCPCAWSPPVPWSGRNPLASGQGVELLAHEGGAVDDGHAAIDETLEKLQPISLDECDLVEIERQLGAGDEDALAGALPCVQPRTADAHLDPDGSAGSSVA